MSEEARKSTDDLIANLSAEACREHLESTFRLHLGDDSGDDTTVLEIVLREVSAVGGDTKRQDRTPFSLLFRGPSDAAIGQGIYRLEHDALGAGELFLVCVGPDPDDDESRMLYEAVFT